MSSASSSAAKETSSPFYYACRNGDTDKVRELIEQMTLKEIDRIEPNGSTALHAASFYGHAEIVKILLKRGASRSLHNKYNAIPYEEASDEIKKLFLRPKLDRFFQDTEGNIDWMKCDAEAEKIAENFRFRHSGFGWSAKNTAHRLKHIKEEMSSTEQEQVHNFLDQAEKNPMSLLRAYTVESDFYRNLNKDLAKRHFEQGTNFGLTYFVDFFYNHPAFKELSFIGTCYRGMSISKDDLQQYRLGTKIMNKAFLSTSIEQQVAEHFGTKVDSVRKTLDGTILKISAVCKFTLVNPRSGLLIENISEFRHEKEVLVGPYTAFLITAVRRVTPTYVEIDLQECKTLEQAEENSDDEDE